MSLVLQNTETRIDKIVLGKNRNIGKEECNQVKRFAEDFDDFILSRAQATYEEYSKTRQYSEMTKAQSSVWKELMTGLDENLRKKLHELDNLTSSESAMKEKEVYLQGFRDGLILWCMVTGRTFDDLLSNG